MPRYNHRVLEKKWLKIWEQQGLSNNCIAHTICIPHSGDLDLENMRILLLTDFFGRIQSGFRPRIVWYSANSKNLVKASVLGLDLSESAGVERCDLVLLPRDFSFLLPRSYSCESLPIGRFFAPLNSEELLEDFGVDALRIYFLFSGPPTRDYSFNWHGLVSAHRFLRRIWHLTTNLARNENEDPMGLGKLQVTVNKRLQQRKPHTALAAVMEFLQQKVVLTQKESKFLSVLLNPFMPFLASEIASLDDGDLK